MTTECSVGEITVSRWLKPAESQI